MAKDEESSGTEWTREAVYKINDDFNQFLHITEDDTHLLKYHQPMLLRDSERFVRTFYDYLFRFPATAQVLEHYQAQGGKIADLVHKHIAHLQLFLNRRLDADSATELTRIGGIHQRHGIKPVWFMGAYLLYFNYLRDVIAKDATLSGEECDQLEEASRNLFSAIWA